MTRRRFLELAATAGLAGTAAWRGHLQAARRVFEEYFDVKEAQIGPVALSESD